jgi:hypothetical protein
MVNRNLKAPAPSVPGCDNPLTARLLSPPRGPKKGLLTVNLFRLYRVRASGTPHGPHSSTEAGGQAGGLRAENPWSRTAGSARGRIYVKPWPLAPRTFSKKLRQRSGASRATGPRSWPERVPKSGCIAAAEIPRQRVIFCRPAHRLACHRAHHFHPKSGRPRFAPPSAAPVASTGASRAGSPL